MAFAATLAIALALGAPAQAATVTVQGPSILVDGRPFLVRGAAGTTRLTELKGLGANTVRTYGGDAERLMAEAERLDLKVILGFWLEHPRRGFDYGNRVLVEAQLAALRAFVLRYKDSPALLMWGIGNEVEAELTDNSQVWPAIEEAARLVESLDPNHPTMAVIADTDPANIRRVKDHAPSIDVLGVNAYGDAIPSLPGRVRAQGWDGPLVVSELGAIGQWQAGQTPWGAPVEPTSTEKAQRLGRYLAALKSDGVGQVLFLWGQKQEVTPTWHSLLLRTGEWTQASEAMAHNWGGATPGGNRAPRIRSFRLADGPVLDRAAPAQAILDAGDPDGDPVAVTWRVLSESTDRRKAGDAETVPPDHSEALRHTDSRAARIEGLPSGDYRLFAVVRDGNGAAATANLPFRVR